MKKLLIVSYLFSPMSAIGAVRWTKLSKYLAQAGYDVTVLTTSAKAPEDVLLIRDAEYIPNIIRIDHKNTRFDCTVYLKDAQAAARSSSEPSQKSLSRCIKDAIWHCRLLKYPTSLYVARNDFSRSKDFYDQAKDYISKNMDISDFDAVICTFGPTSGALLARWIKKKYPKTPVIMDFRDPMTNLAVPWPYRSMYKHIQNKTCTAADRVIAVTEDLGSRICGRGQLSQKCCIIPNGYDPEDFTGIESVSSSKYSFVYTGAIYKDFADFSPLFTALKELSAAGEIDLDDIVINYIGRSGATLEEQAAAHGLSDIIENYGVMPRQQTLAWQRGARQLLLTIWNNKNDGGYRPGKLLEYMAAGRPVIGLVSGDAENSILRRTVEQGKFGIAHESAASQADYKALREYIAADYKRWKQGLEPELSPDSDYINSFSYPELARQVAELIEEI